MIKNTSQYKCCICEGEVEIQESNSKYFGRSTTNTLQLGKLAHCLKCNHKLALLRLNE